MTNSELLTVMGGRVSITSIQKHLKYDKNTGLIYWKFDKGKMKTGQIAGFLGVDGYIKIKINSKQYPAHRLAWALTYGFFPRNEIDHINHIRNDNRLVNLREAKRFENCLNQTKSSTNKSKLTGVCVGLKTGSWRAQIGYKMKRIHLYWGHDFFEACCARKSAEHKYGFHLNHGRQ